MANLYDFIEKNGDKSFKELPPTEIDYAILANIGYLKFENIVPENNKTVVLGDVADEILNSPLTRSERPEYALLQVLKTKERYKNLKLSNFASKFDEKEGVQFAGVLIHLNNKDKVISFRGTDGTFLGWKEDFDLLYKNPIPAALAGDEYLEKMVLFHPFSNFTVLGHSKGGHVALYSTLNASPWANLRIKQTYSFDGPGINTGLDMDLWNRKAINKCHSFFPTGSVIGRLFTHDEQYTVVPSEIKNINQHTSYSWKIDENTNTFAKAEDFDRMSNTVNAVLESIFDSLNIEEKKDVSDTLYDLMVNTKCADMAELRADMKKLIYSYRTLSIKRKAVVKDILFRFAKHPKVLEFILWKLGLTGKDVLGVMNDFVDSVELESPKKENIIIEVNKNKLTKKSDNNINENEEEFSMC